LLFSVSTPEFSTTWQCLEFDEKEVYEKKSISNLQIIHF